MAAEMAIKGLVFSEGLRRQWREVRGLFAATVVTPMLTVPMMQFSSVAVHTGKWNCNSEQRSLVVGTEGSATSLHST
jgi:hypothetical protein